LKLRFFGFHNRSSRKIKDDELNNIECVELAHFQNAWFVDCKLDFFRFVLEVDVIDY
jgi:hypothetical protein